MQAETRRRRRVNLLPAVLIAPTAFFVILFTIWPSLLATYQSFFLQRLNIARFRQPTYVGLENYAVLFGDPEFQRVLANTALYVLGTVPVSIVLAFLFALLVNRKVRGIGFARLGLFHPTILPLVSAATIWLFMFTPDYGLFNSFLKFFGYRGPENWTANPTLALVAVMIVTVWKNAGYYMLFYLAGLQGLPPAVFEAAAIDGANAWQQLWRIAFPLLRRTTLFIATISIIGAFQTVDHIFVLTQGGPSRASTVLLFALWEERFVRLNVGVASAMTVVLVLVLLGFTLANFSVGEEREQAYAR